MKSVFAERTRIPVVTGHRADGRQHAPFETELKQLVVRGKLVLLALQLEPAMHLRVRNRRTAQLVDLLLSYLSVPASHTLHYRPSELIAQSGTA
jgi:hypothetical protein